MLDTDILRVRLEKVAHALAGRRVWVWFMRPYTKGANGESVLGKDGVPVIRLAPELLKDEPELLWVFLHEAAHVKLHAKDWVPGAWDKVRPGTLETAGARKHAIIRQRESEANSLALQWLSYARENATKSASSPGLERALDVLSISPEMRKHIDVVVTKAVENTRR